MAIVQTMKKSAKMKIFADLLSAVCQRVENMADGYSEIRPVFDSYKLVTFKSKTRQKRANSSKTPCREVTPNTNSKLVMSLKELLSSSVTKAALVPFLAQSLQNHFANKPTILTICYDEKIVGPEHTEIHSHEEADTLIPNQVQ